MSEPSEASTRSHFANLRRSTAIRLNAEKATEEKRQAWIAAGCPEVPSGDPWAAAQAEESAE